MYKYISLRETMLMKMMKTDIFLMENYKLMIHVYHQREGNYRYIMILYTHSL